MPESTASERMKLALANLRRGEDLDGCETVKSAIAKAREIEAEHGLPTHEEFLAAKVAETLLCDHTYGHAPHFWIAESSAGARTASRGKRVITPRSVVPICGTSSAHAEQSSHHLEQHRSPSNPHRQTDADLHTTVWR
jgi:hypothetical protein